MGGYPYASSSSQPHGPVLPQPIPQTQLQQQQREYPSASPPQHQPYITHESDVNYSRKMFRDLGYDETADGVSYAAVNGYALTMPGGPFSIPFGMQSAGGMGYGEPQGQGQVTHAPNHGGYTQTNHQGSRHHYQPYPPPSYNNGHTSHGGYGGIPTR
jgi:hypothetical protein